MDAITKRLPLLAFVLAAFAAVAFSPKEQPMNVYGYDGTHWYEVTGDPSPNTYACDEAEEPGCLYDAIGGNPIDPDVDRVFVTKGLLPIED